MTDDKHIPGKRIKTWHRQHLAGDPQRAISLKAFARSYASSPDKPTRETAKAWLAGKRSR